MSLSVTLPVGIGLKDWADCLIIDFDAFGVYEPLEDPDKWQDWAMHQNFSSRDKIDLLKIQWG